MLRIVRKVLAKKRRGTQLKRFQGTGIPLHE